MNPKHMVRTGYSDMRPWVDPNHVIAITRTLSGKVGVFLTSGQRVDLPDWASEESLERIVRQLMNPVEHVAGERGE